ncbi:hypothetical protein DBR32_06260 [Taibaiella sp. KBW10]|uniref:RDD family protein n=1 Tax=Taibaiella sp. KBW10 TaxID=2153357 RepID=UPI000F596B1E|nr:RDD family protein [Taibaiella sp. KBW10]RQO31558.1 hypothetical protein DBR32_06260 [Taibaiella sp. KBW10]
MAKLTVHTPFNIDLDFVVAPLLKRAAAYGIDIIITAIFAFIMFSTVVDKAANYEQFLEFTNLFLVALPIYFYHLICEIMMNGQSIGKKIMGIRVVNENGNAASTSQYLLRWILSIPNLISVVIAYYLFFYPAIIISVILLAVPDIISIAISDTGKRIGDRAANTVVVEIKNKVNIENTIFKEVDTHKEYIPKFPEVMLLTDKDINSIRNLMTQKRTKELDLYVDRVSRRIEEVLKVRNTSMDAYYFFEELLIDYNYITQQKLNR